MASPLTSVQVRLHLQLCSCDSRSTPASHPPPPPQTPHPRPNSTCKAHTAGCRHINLLSHAQVPAFRPARSTAGTLTPGNTNALFLRRPRPRITFLLFDRNIITEGTRATALTRLPLRRCPSCPRVAKRHCLLAPASNTINHHLQSPPYRKGSAVSTYTFP